MPEIGMPLGLTCALPCSQVCSEFQGLQMLMLRKQMRGHEEMAQLGLLLKHEDLSSGVQHPDKSWAPWHAAVTPAPEGRGESDPGAQRSATPARFGERLGLKNKMAKCRGKYQILTPGLHG